MNATSSTTLAKVLVAACLCGSCSRTPVDVSGQVFIVTKGRQNVEFGDIAVAAYSEQSVSLLHNAILEELKKAKVQNALMQERINAIVEERRKLKGEKAAILAKMPVPEYPLSMSSADYTKLLDAQRAAVDAQFAVREQDIQTRLDAAMNDLSASLPDAAKEKDLDFHPANIRINDGLRNLVGPLVVAKTDSNGRFKMRLPGNTTYVFVASARRELNNSSEEDVWCVKKKVESTTEDILLSNDNTIESHSKENVFSDVVASSYY